MGSVDMFCPKSLVNLADQSVEHLDRNDFME